MRASKQLATPGLQLYQVYSTAISQEIIMNDQLGL